MIASQDGLTRASAPSSLALQPIAQIEGKLIAKPIKNTRVITAGSVGFQ